MYLRNNEVNDRIYIKIAIVVHRYTEKVHRFCFRDIFLSWPFLVVALSILLKASSKERQRKKTIAAKLI